MAKSKQDIKLSESQQDTPYPVWPERTRGLNFFSVDHNLQRFLTRYNPALMQNDGKRLEDLGKFCSTELDEQAEYSDRIHPPVLKQGIVDLIRPDERRSYIYLNERYKDTQQELYRRELLAKCFAPGNNESHMLPFIGQYLVSHSDVSTGCPFAMTHPVAYVLAHYAPEFLRQKYLPELLRTDGTTAVGGTWATEKHSGSDIGNTTTKVTKHRDGHYRLQGHNWFTSAIGFNRFLAIKTARPDDAPAGSKGLGLYLVPSHIDDDWNIPNEYHVTHLKDKLGTRGLPTGEVRLDGTLCYEIVPAGQGLKIMMEALGCSRIHNAMGSAGIMHRALLESLCWTSHRAPFGKRLIEQPIIQKRLTDIMTEWMAGSALAFQAAHCFDEAVHDPSQKSWGRIVTALAKFKTAEQAVWCADKALTLVGGNGYTEEYPTARQYRDAMVTKVWEGPEQIQALELMRMIGTSPADTQLFMDKLTEIAQQLPDAMAGEKDHIRTLNGNIHAQFKILAANPASAAETADDFLRDMADILAYALLCDEAAWEVTHCNDQQKLLVARHYYERTCKRCIGPAPTYEPLRKHFISVVKNIDSCRAR
ncbi:MAG: acyl-CoA dehydrogenase family protein [Nitrospira sp.]|nr:acyl-CoA dehydrogenase family protein [Nitrospira sp.]